MSTRTRSDTLEPPVSGLVAGKYEVVQLIGRGGMGSVWEGRHATLGTRVAIKFIDAEYADSKEARSRFETEARAAAALHSKHAIQIFDHGLTGDGRPYMVMELLQGEPLDKRIDRQGRISLAETARILGQVCRALQRAHDANIIHRDLKPENIFLVRTPDDDDEIAKVLDFGIAKIKVPPGEQGLTSSTKTGAVLGTPYYMSPEQARGLRTIDTRSDLWSLGVIAYKCVTGVLPFEGESVGDLLVKICTAPPPVPSMTLPGLPPAFDAWFARTMEREPERRYASASELADALAFAAGLSVRRGPTSSQPDAAGMASSRVSPYASPAGPALQAQTPLPAAGMTSAPFTTSAGLPPRSSRGALLAVAAAAIVGGSIGVFAVVKLLGSEKHTPAAQGAPTAMTVSSAGVLATRPGTSVPAPTGITAPSAASSDGASSTATATATATVVATATPGRGGKPGPRPVNPPPPPPGPAPTHTPVKPPPPSSDPGY